MKSCILWLSKSPRHAPTIALKANWRKDWNSDTAASSSSCQPTEQNQLASTVQPVIATQWVNAWSTKRRRSQRWRWRVQGLPHSKVEQAEKGRGRDLIRSDRKPILTKMIYKLIWDRPTSTIHSARIQRKWFTSLATWSTSNCAKQILKYNVPIASLIAYKVFNTALVKFAWVTRTKCVRWIENALMHYRFQIMW